MQPELIGFISFSVTPTPRLTIVRCDFIVRILQSDWAKQINLKFANKAEDKIYLINRILPSLVILFSQNIHLTSSVRLERLSMTSQFSRSE